ncbi:MAG: two-component regulator propeller domain-containing protein, partial [Niabella sp.]
MKRWLPFNLIGWFCLLAEIMDMHQLHAQQPYQFSTYTTADGLSDNRVTCVFKDKTGYVWVGTKNGLNRFDGHSFLIYRPGRQKNTLSGSIINDIKQDRYGHLWVATQNGLNRIDMVSDTTITFLPADTHSDLKKTIPSNLIWSLYIDDNDRVWMAPDMRDLCYYDIRKKKFISYGWFNYLEKNFPHRHNKYNSVRKIYRKSENELWLGTSVGLFSINIHTGVFTHYPSWEADHFIQLVSDSAANTVYFIQQPGDAVQALHNNSGKTQTIPFGSIAAPGYNDFGNKHWLPANNQLLQIDPVHQTFSKISHETDNFYSLPKGNLNTVYHDDSGLLWIGSDAGLSKVNPNPGAFQFFPVFDNNVAPLKAERDLFRRDHLLHSILYDSTHSKFYLSSSTKHCFLIIDSRTGNKKTITAINGIPLKNCSYLYKDKKGMIWILANRHAFIYDPKKNEFTTTAFKCAASFFTGMTEDADGNMWIAGYNDGVYKYDLHSKVTTKLIWKNEHNSELPTSLYFDERTNKLWVGTFSIGLYSYNIRTDQFQFFMQSAKPGGINTSLITGITKGKDGKLWISSYAGGVIIYDPSVTSGKFISVNTANGLPDDNVYSIIADGKGKIWGTTYYSLFSVDEGSRKVTVYDRNHGLHYTDFHSRFILSE